MIELMIGMVIGYFIRAAIHWRFNKKMCKTIDEILANLRNRASRGETR